MHDRAASEVTMGSGRWTRRIRTSGIFSSTPLMIGWIGAAALAGVASWLTRTIWIDVASDVLMIGLEASVGAYAVWELRRWGSLSFPINATAVATVGLCLLTVAPLFVHGGPTKAIEVGLLGIFGIIVVSCWFAPRRVVALTGGPRVEWRLLEERCLIAAEAAEAERDANRDAPGFDRVQALDRFRTPRTADYIDTYQRLAFAGPDGPIPAPEFRALEEHFADAERELFRFLRVRPAWVEELDARIRGPESLVRPAEPGRAG
jgi:hypothetical protein